MSAHFARRDLNRKREKGNVAQEQNFALRLSFMHTDQRFDGVVAGGHGLEQFGQPGQRTFAVHKIFSADDAGFDDFQRTADGPGCVMKTGQQGEVGIMNGLGIERGGGAAGATAKKVHCAAFANEGNGSLPNLWLADGFDDSVKLPFG